MTDGQVTAGAGVFVSANAAAYSGRYVHLNVALTHTITQAIEVGLAYRCSGF